MGKEIEKSEITAHIGYKSPPTEWMLIDQQAINDFADATHDHQFIHVDTELAKTSPFGGTVAHGFLTLSLLSYLSIQFGLVIKGAYMGLNYGFEKVRFLAPVKVDSRIRAVATVTDIQETSPGTYKIITSVTIEVEGTSKPAMVAEWITVQMVA